MILKTPPNFRKYFGAMRLWPLLLLGMLIPGQLLFGQLTSNAQISVITCGPGEELYSSFGHSAFRVQDQTKGIDLIYNYGTFDFNTSNFYLKFARGKLLYSLSRQRFEDFLYTYQLENRWVKEQILKLTDQQKNELFRFLETNYLPENRDYKYDFLFDNCSTKIPEVLGKVLGDGLEFPEKTEDRYTFRELIQQYLKTNSWGSFGIDLALGSVIDRRATAYEHMFLPDYVLSELNNTRLNSEPLVLRERDILEHRSPNHGNYFTLSPAFWLLLAVLFTATLTFIDLKNGSRNRVVDFLLFFVPGLAGLFIVFLWFFTDHTATAGNFNLFWAFPVNIVVAFLLHRKPLPPAWLPGYLLLVLGLLLLAIAFWLFGIQTFSPLLVVLWTCIALRYTFLYGYYKNLLASRS